MCFDLSGKKEITIEFQHVTTLFKNIKLFLLDVLTKL